MFVPHSDLFRSLVSQNPNADCLLRIDNGILYVYVNGADSRPSFETISLEFGQNRVTPSNYRANLERIVEDVPLSWVPKVTLEAGLSLQEYIRRQTDETDRKNDARRSGELSSHGEGGTTDGGNSGTGRGRSGEPENPQGTGRPIRAGDGNPSLLFLWKTQNRKPFLGLLTQ